ncbi:hypothetical protein ACOSQ2_004675 [Xanthoceras sorbifolium]
METQFPCSCLLVSTENFFNLSSKNDYSYRCHFLTFKKKKKTLFSRNQSLKHPSNWERQIITQIMFFQSVTRERKKKGMVIGQHKKKKKQ